MILNVAGHKNNTLFFEVMKAGIFKLLAIFGGGSVCFLSAVLANEVIVLPHGTKLQSIIDSHPASSHYELESGVHRGHEVVLKEGDTLSGQPGAVLSGAELLLGWRFEDPFWVHDGPHSKVVQDKDDSPRPGDWEYRATWPHDLFVDDIPIIQKYHPSLIIDETSWAYDYEEDRVYVRFPPVGHKMELSGLCRYGLRTSASGVTLRNVQFEKYATLGQSGAVELGENALIEGCTVLGSHATGIRITSNSQVRNCRLMWNGNAGLHNGASRSLIEYCEFAYNGWAGFSGAWSRGGLKVPNLCHSTVRRNYAHHNTGPGIWFDINSHDNICEENLCEFNTWEGILFELSCGCDIRRNVLRWNGLIPRNGLLWGVPIVIQNAEHADVHHNYLEGDSDSRARGGGVTIINQDRPQHTAGVCGTHVPEGNHIHDNVIVMPKGGYNGLQYGNFGWDTYEDFLNAGNLWERNLYLTGAPVTVRAFHWHEQGATNEDIVNSYHTWDEWQALGQDAGSEFIGRHRSFFNAANPELDALILATTGVGYDELKAPFLKPSFDPDIDHDGDQMPDGWELSFGLDPLLADSGGDMDEDGLSNLEEYRAGINPSVSDTDGDRMPDGWELREGLQPKVADDIGDPDADSLSNFEEFEAGSSPRIRNPLMGEFPTDGLTMWLKSGAPLRVNENGEITPWPDWRNGGITMARAYNHRGPLISEELTNGYPVLHFGPGDLKTTGGLVFDGESDGWTLIMVFKPRQVDGSAKQYALMANSVWRESGFRLTLEQGYLHFYSTQPENKLSVRSHKRLLEETVVVTLIYDEERQKGRIYVDGEEQARGAGTVPANNMSLWIGNIGGMSYQPADYSEVITFSRALKHLERREVEAMLRGKYQSSGMAMADSDGDGMADWWEIEYGGVDGTLADPDDDGLLNIEEFQNRTNPVSSDTDGDTLSDCWEINNDWNPRRDDSAVDADSDGLSSVAERIAGTLPDNSDTDSDGMPDGWEFDHGLDPLVGDIENDADADGLTDIQEFGSGTNPILTDTDGDTLDDFWEITNGWNPLMNDSVVDTDGDGLTNLEEVQHGTSFVLADTDGDGFNDHEEVVMRSDPNDPESRPNFPPVFDDQSFSVPRSIVVGTEIGNFSATDRNGDIISYSIVTNVDPDHDGIDAFRLQGDRLLVNDSGDLSYRLGVIPIAAGAVHNVILGPEGNVFGLGSNDYGQINIPEALGKVSVITAGSYHSLALQEDGKLFAWGRNDYGQVDMPGNLGAVSAIAAGDYHSLALQANGEVVGWGSNNYGQVNVPGNLGSVNAVSAGAWHSMALRTDGKVVAWGINNWGQRTVPTDLDSVIAIAAGALHSLALKPDGRVVAWGQNTHRQKNVPVGLTGVVAISAGGYHNLALRENGTVVAWGHNNYGQVDVPAGLTGVIAISAGDYHNLALKSDGTLVGWGRNSDEQASIPEGLQIAQPGIIRPELLQIEIQASDSENFDNAAIIVNLLNDPNEDIDGDGLSHETEIAEGTDPLLADTDGDGMLDGWEIRNILDPLLNDSGADYDFDGISNIDELVAGSSPVEWLDSDKDGMHDLWESGVGLVVGIADGIEDNDRDLQSNFMEFVFGGDPMDAARAPGVRAWLEASGEPVVEFQRSRSGSRYYNIVLEIFTEELIWEPLPSSALTISYADERIEKFVLHPPVGGNEIYRIKVTPRF